MLDSELGRRDEFIRDLRRLAAYLEANPTLPVPYGLDVMTFPKGDTEQEAIAEIDRIATVIQETPEENGGRYRVSKPLGRVCYLAIVLTKEVRDRWSALISYDGAVSPDPDSDSYPEGVTR